MDDRRIDMSTAGIQTLDVAMTLDAAREAADLGYSRLWAAEAVGLEAMASLGAVSVAAPTLGLATGVVALQLRTPPLAAMAAATLQQLRPDRDVMLGIGISSPVVAGAWHGAQYSDRPLRQVREYVALLRECLTGEAVTFEGDFYTVRRFRLGVQLGERRPRIVIGALNPKMLRLAGEIADGVLLNYLPASHVPWSVQQVRAGGEAPVYAFVHCGVTDPERHADRARKDLFQYAVVDAYAHNFARAGYADDVESLRAAHAARDREAALGAISDRWVSEVEILGDSAHVRAGVEEYRRNGVDVPIVFAHPWGDDRREVLANTLRACA